jgi:nucleoid-associated protein Lsr2
MAMARETVTRLVDDLDGGVAHETVRFGLDGQQFEIDLSTRNAKKLRAELAPFVEHGNRLSARVARAGRAASRSVSGRDQNRSIREWAMAKGYDIAPRGRIKQDIVDAFHQRSGR